MASFLKGESIADFQEFNHLVYSPVDDRFYSIQDLLIQQQRFSMRALKGMRKRDKEKLKENLLIAFSFLMAIANRLHIDIEKTVWERFPMVCSYCGKRPCVCKKTKVQRRVKITRDNSLRPKSLAGFQKMFDAIYPSSTRTVSDAGVHFAEEIGEVAEATLNFLSQHRPAQFKTIKNELADCVSCAFGIANSAKIDFSTELASMFKNNCHVCHKVPCQCSFASVASY